MTDTTLPLTAADVVSYADVLNGVFAHAKVRLLLDSGDIMEGTLRYLDGDEGESRPDDIRDAYVRITSVTGFEHWFPFVDLARKHAHGEFAIEKG